jgi:putative spermidine/putrescine transport system substrate-binding protein
MALLADGVPIDKLYPLDLERAWAAMDRLRPLVTKWYANHAEAIQLLSSGEIDICCTIGPRGITAKREGAPIEVITRVSSRRTTGQSLREHGTSTPCTSS